MKESLKKYLEYAESEDEFTYRVRMERAWDDPAYLAFIALIMDVINDYKETDVVPIPIVLFFTSGLDQLVGTISNPDFFLNTSKTYQDLVEARRLELLALQKIFFSGELFMKE
ncbi:hypothetical protein [Chitinophaga niastensis]|nr:hypothetical protein [Chitinophaga niastensis]